MFRSSFAKYLTAFVIIISVSFLLMSSIITSIVRTHATEDKYDKLETSCSAIASLFEERNVRDLETYIVNSSEVSSAIMTLIPVLNIDYTCSILVTNVEGTVLLSTVGATSKPSIYGELGSLDLSLFKTVTEEDEEFLNYRGELSGIVGPSSLTYGKRIVTEGQTVGYVFSIVSTEREDRLIQIMRNTVINSSIWVLLAAVIAAYFITERIVNPLRAMTRASKKFAKGDFTERVTVSGRDEVAELATAFNHMADSLDNLEKMRNTFLASVSHDLRTPMTTIAGFIDGITSGAIPEEQHGYYLEYISTEVHRLSRLVSQLLDVSRLESGDRKFNFTDFDVAELSRLIIISFERKLEEKRLEVEFITDEDSVLVRADKDSIHQVIYNLCHNAIKFSRETGRFIISITREKNKRIRISVYDDGQTLTESDVNHIFDRFYKSDESRGLDKNGVGLGLYICKTIIEAHGEQIGVIAHEDGCEFYFTLKEGESPTRTKGAFTDEWTE